MAATPAQRERIHPETRAQWRAWLAEHAGTTPGVWLVSWRKGVGRPAVSYDESVEEALCFGWVDSTANRLDDERTMLYFAPRKRGSGWSRSNKQRIERLIAAGLMTEAGLRVVERARQDGSWRLLDAVEDLVVPDDLAAELAARPSARDHWDGFPPSARKAILTWIVQARRDETRRRRVVETAECAQRGERANQPWSG
ncbi:MAG TPA: YdeI/OmpD-associated family protein [Pilimelia sp.]|nr:YdeI/OmpD-associated family protein [Pilimelia sp.]